MKKHVIIALSLCCFTLFMSCNNATPPTSEDCQYGKPVAVFSPDMSGVRQHKFTLSERVGTETLLFDNGVLLELEQSGCNEIKQEFTFLLAGREFPNVPQFWQAKSIDLFRYMANLDVRTAALNDWAAAIENLSELRLGEATMLQPGFYITIDKIMATQQTRLIVTLESKS